MNKKTNRADEQALFEARKKQVDKKLQELKEAGNIKEAALVVSYDGLDLLVTMFNNSNKQVIQEAVQDAVREELKAAMAGIFEGIIRKYLETIRPAEPEKDDSMDALRYAAEDLIKQAKETTPEHKPLSVRIKEQQEERRESLGIAKKHNKRWDQEEELELYNLVKTAEAAGETIEAAFKRFSAESGRSIGAVKYKYYTKFVKGGADHETKGDYLQS